MKKISIGYIFNSKRKGIEEKTFFRVAKNMNIDLILFNLSDKIDEEEIEKKAKDCKIFFNDAGDEIAYELVKTLEELGKKVTEPSKVAYYPEDKWLFFVMCKKYKISTPKTILLSTDLNSAKKELREFNQWPVVLKRIFGCRGEFVEKANNLNEAINLIKQIWKKGNDERLPIIAQEYINSDSYRVTVIGDKIVQTSIKKRSGWKASGCYAEKFRKFNVDSKLKKIVNKLIKICGIKICGLDFAKRGDEWLVIEANAEPSLKFFDGEHEKLIEKVLKFLINSS